MSEIINNNNKYVIHTDGRIYVKLGGRYIALLDEEGNLNLKLRNTITTVNSLSSIDTEGLYYYEGNVYAWVDGEPRLLSGSGGSGEDISVVNLVLEGDLRAVTSNAVAQSIKNIKSNILPFEGMVFTSQVSFNPIQHSNGTIKFSLSLKCFVLENLQDGVARYFTNWKGSDVYQIINPNLLSNIQLRPDVVYLDVVPGTLYIKGNSNDLNQVITSLDMDNYISKSKDVDLEITLNSTNVITSGAVYNALSKIRAVEFFNGITSVNDVLELVNGTYSGSTYLIIYSHYYKTFVAKVTNQSLVLYYKKWQTSDKFLNEEGNPNRNLIYIYNNTLYIWNNELIEVVSSSSSSDSLIILVEYMIEGSNLPIPDSSNLGKFAIAYNNSIYSLYQAEDVNNTILYIPKQFSINKLYINNNKLYLWNGETLIEVGKSNFKYKTASFYGILNDVSVKNQKYSGLDGDIIYANNLNKFVCRVLSLGNETFYSNWNNSELYFNEEHTFPRTDIIYVNNNTGYVYDELLVSIGGIGSGSSDGQITVDRNLSTQSYNAISNSTVTNAINTTNTNLNSLSLRVSNLEGSTANSNILKNEFNELGTYYVPNENTPVIEENTKYIISKNIIGSEDITNTSGTATFYISDDESNLLLIYATYYLNNKPWVDGDDTLQLGKQVTIYGKLSNSNGTIRTSPKKSYLYSITDPSGNQSSQISGAGTLNSPFNVAAANNWANENLELGEESQLEFYIKGTILNIVENFTLSKLILQTGSKIVPNGGISTIPVEGGELSWVHSSDIGMLQDDALLSESARTERGKTNAKVLRMVAKSRWNLILDGTYYVYAEEATDEEQEAVGYNPADYGPVELPRTLRLQGGGINAKDHLFVVMGGGGLVCENVTFTHESGLRMIEPRPGYGVIGSMEFYGCRFAGFGGFIRGRGANVAPTDTVADGVCPILRNYNQTNLEHYFGLTENPSPTGSRYAMTDATATKPRLLYVYPAGQAAPGKNSSITACQCCYQCDAPMFFPQADGEYVFRLDSSGIFKHMGSRGNMIPVSEVRSSDSLYTENGLTVHFTNMSVMDDCDPVETDGEGHPLIVRGAIPPVERMGVERFVIDGCRFTNVGGNGGDLIVFGGMGVYDLYTVTNSIFEKFTATALNFGTFNDYESADEWASRTMPLRVEKCTFHGQDRVTETGAYHAAVVGEVETVIFRNNRLENLISTGANYDVYLSCAKVYYTGNVVHNVVPFKASNSNCGYMKAKLIKMSWPNKLENAERTMDPTVPLCRVYEDNIFEVSLKEVSKLCRGYVYITEEVDATQTALSKSWLKLGKDDPTKREPALYRIYRLEADSGIYHAGDLFMWNGQAYTQIEAADGKTAEEVAEEIYMDLLERYVLKVSFENVVSSWGMEEYTVRNNTFDMPSVRLIGRGISGGCTVSRRWSLENNTLRFRSFPSTPTDGYDSYIFGLNPVADVDTEVSIVGNRFFSGGGEIVNLLGLNNNAALGSLRMEDNAFAGCGYRIACRDRQTGWNTGSFDGPVVARKMIVRNNREDAGLDHGYEFELGGADKHLYGNTYTTTNGSMFFMQGVPVMLRGEGELEYWDSQRQGVPASQGKYILLPQDGSRLTVRSTHWCRPMPCWTEAEPDTNPSALHSLHIRTAANTTLLDITDIEGAPLNANVTLECGSVDAGVQILKEGLFSNIAANWTPAVGDRITLRLTETTSGGVTVRSFTEISRQTAAEHADVEDEADYCANRALALVHALPGNTIKGFCITVRYRLRGVWKERKMEMRCTDVNETGSYTNFRGATVRGVDGRRIVQYLAGDAGVRKHLTPCGIDELGLYFDVMHKNLNSAGLNYTASCIRLSLYTGGEGTLNDPGTEMTVEVSDIATAADSVRSSGGNIKYGDTSLFSTFVPCGSVMTSAQRTALLTGDTVAYNKAIGQGTAKCTLQSADAGYWVVDPNTGLKVIWNGSSWVSDKAMVIMTQTEYNALQNVDENTLYIIQNQTT